MALKTRLSEFSREKLVEVIREPWFAELLEVLRNIGSFSIIPVTPSTRTFSEMEFQALNAAYRTGALTSVEHIPSLAQPLKEKAPEPAPQFGNLVPMAPSPKALSQAPKQN